MEEWYAIKLCFKLGKDATETYGMLQTAFGASCMNRASVFEWHKRFKEGRESLREDERCGRSKEVKIPELIGKIKSFTDKDRRVPIDTISAQFDVTMGTIFTIIARYRRCGRFARSLSYGCSEKFRKKDVVMTAGIWSSWSIHIPQFLMLRWPAMKLHLLRGPRDQETGFPVEAWWLSQTQEGQTANPPRNSLLWGHILPYPKDGLVQPKHLRRA